jgi:hypothetical protein
VALPVLDYWWLRQVWKIALWCRYLFFVAGLPLALVASHPDRTGGLGFLSNVQTRFGLVILAYGLSNVASTVGYKLGVEGAPFTQTTVWFPLVAFVIGAPVLFTAPLFMFTGQLYWAKRKALARIDGLASERARTFEREWVGGHAAPSLDPEVTAWSHLGGLFAHIQAMRVVPFDLRSFAELMANTLGALLPLLAYLKLPDPLLKVIEGGSKFLR